MMDRDFDVIEECISALKESKVCLWNQDRVGADKCYYQVVALLEERLKETGYHE